MLKRRAQPRGPLAQARRAVRRHPTRRVEHLRSASTSPGSISMPYAAVLDDRRDGADRRRDHGQAGRHRLEQRHRQALGIGGQHEQSTPRRAMAILGRPLRRTGNHDRRRRRVDASDVHAWRSRYPDSFSGPTMQDEPTPASVRTRARDPRRPSPDTAPRETGSAVALRRPREPARSVIGTPFSTTCSRAPGSRACNRSRQPSDSTTTPARPTRPSAGDTDDAPDRAHPETRRNGRRGCAAPPVRRAAARARARPDPGSTTGRCRCGCGRWPERGRAVATSERHMLQSGSDRGHKRTAGGRLLRRVEGLRSGNRRPATTRTDLARRWPCRRSRAASAPP